MCRIFISGSIENSAVESKAKNLARSIALEMVANGYRICTSMDLGIGFVIAGSVVNYLIDRGMDVDDVIKIRPVDEFTSRDQQFRFRKRIIGMCDAIVFMFGGGADGNSANVVEEYKIAKFLKKPLIPLGFTGYASKEIYDEVLSSIEDYSYLKPYAQYLGNYSMINYSSDLVVKILDIIFRNKD